MAVVTVQPGMFSSGLKTERWSSGLFSCCEDMGICCCGFWCPCVLACQLSSDFGECFCMPLLPVTAAFRSSMRERYRIQGFMFDDCCIAYYCYACVWCQMAREMKLRKRPLLLNSAPGVTTVEVNANPPPHVPVYGQGLPRATGYYMK
ncbi:cornifelin homolog [Diretmus argenteus]